MAQRAGVLDVIGHLYDAATDMEKWPVFVEALAPLFDASITNIVHFGTTDARFNLFHFYGADLSPHMVLKFQEVFAEDPRVIAAAQLPAKPLSCRHSIGEEAWRKSKTYTGAKEFGLDIEYSMVVVLPDDKGGMTALGIVRGKDGTAFTQDECDLLGEIVPHIKRAVDLQKKFAVADYSRRSGLELADHIPNGIILTDEDGVVQHANAAAAEIAKRKDGISFLGDCVTLSRRKENADFQLAIRNAVRSARDGTILAGHPMAVTRTNGRESYPLMVSTLWGNHIKLGLGILDDPLAVIFITDPDRPQEAPVELLQRMYGLTPSEARLLDRLVAGDTVDDAASAVGLTVNSARQYLKSIFQKTDTNRQSDLIKKVVTSPIWLHHKAWGDKTTSAS